MKTTVCKHQHKMKLIDFMVEVFPMGTKTCDTCHRKIRLNWFWRIVYLLISIIGPGSMFLAIFYRLSLWAGLLVIAAAWCLQLIIAWQIALHGKYVLKK